MINRNNQNKFLEILRGGLWEQDVQISKFEKFDFKEVYRIAQEQSVIGVVAAGLEHVTDLKIPQEIALIFASSVLHLEQRNKAMNKFVAQIIEKLQKDSVYTILVKGQGIAQCYERPLWRACGDVDLLLSEMNYSKAAMVLKEGASYIDDENDYNKHLAMNINGWIVELHGTLYSGLWRNLDKIIDDVQKEVLYGGKVRSWVDERTQVFLPHPDEDIVFIFAHILQHFYKEGVGLRQICDWCRLLWTYKETINKRLLESRIRQMGVMSEWKAFAALAVDNLGMPVEAMPFYSNRTRWRKKGAKVMDFVLQSGNFGHNRDYSYYEKYPYVVVKAISLWRHLVDFCRYFVIFPLDAIKVTWRKICIGLSVAIKGKRHE